MSTKITKTKEHGSTLSVIEIDGDVLHSHSIYNPEVITEIVELARKLTRHERTLLDDILNMIRH